VDIYMHKTAIKTFIDLGSQAGALVHSQGTKYKVIMEEDQP
jgi:hypothetical protein